MTREDPSTTLRPPDGPEAFIGFVKAFPEASVDILLVFADREIVEHWDVLQPFPEGSANPHPMF